MLTLFAIFHPNEFPPISEETNITTPLRQRRGTNIVSPYRTVALGSSEVSGVVKVTIKDYKMKVENGKQIVYFNILVKFIGESQTVRRTYIEFDTLHKALRLKFPVDQFPYMAFPTFPLFRATFSLDQRMKELSAYLNDLCKPELMADELLDFLEIKGQPRKFLLDEHIKYSEAERCIDITNEDGSARLDSYTFNHFQSQPDRAVSNEKNTYLNLQRYIKISIVEWIGVNDGEDSHIEYAIKWQSCVTSAEGKVKKRFKEFYELHKILKKSLSPARLPKFPSKNYLHNLRKIDDIAIEMRKRKLELYLGHILNDPAFHAKEVFDFIGFNIEREALIENPFQDYTYVLFTPIGWEGELDNDSHYIVYILSFAKLLKGKKICE